MNVIQKIAAGVMVLCVVEVTLALATGKMNLAVAVIGWLCAGMAQFQIYRREK